MSLHIHTNIVPQTIELTATRQSGGTLPHVVTAGQQALALTAKNTFSNSLTQVGITGDTRDSAVNVFASSFTDASGFPSGDSPTTQAVLDASFRNGKQGVRGVGIASGSFNLKAVLKKMRLQKFKPTKYRNSDLYPMDGGMLMSFLDDGTLLFGEPSAVRSALDVRDGQTLNVDSNASMADLMSAVDSAPVWSILDQQGTQNMMRSALGDASKIADYDTLKKRLLGSRYTMNFNSGVNFDLAVVTSDSLTAATLSSLVKEGILYKKMNASASEKMAMENTTVDCDGANLQIHFKSNDQQFQALMHSDLFAAVSR